MTPQEENEMKMMMEEDKEQWASIEGCEGYEVSTYGRVRSYWKFGGNSRRGTLSSTPIRILKAGLNIRGYFTVILYQNNTKRSTTIHRLVATTFIPNPFNYLCVDHIDRNKQNNHISNLRWGSYSQNAINCKMMARNTSGVKGVCYDKTSNLWCSNYCQNEHKQIKKYFKTKEEAVEHRKKMVEEHYNQEFYHEG